MLRRYIYAILTFVAVVAMLSVTSCRDDFDLNPGVIDGSEMMLGVEVSFDGETAVDLKTRATNGDAIQGINSLWMVVYDADGQLKERLEICRDSKGVSSENISNVNVTLDDNRLDGEKTGDGILADQLSGRVTFNWRTVSARYYIYAVVNFADFSSISADEISSPDKLKSLKLTWNPANVASNNQMFGVFTINPNRDASDVSKVFTSTPESERVAITNTTSSIHCWVNRLASKVTVAFDGTELYDNVQVFIQSITIHDIPSKCYLGRENSPGKSKSTDKEEPAAADRYTGDDALIRDGESIVIEDMKGIPDLDKAYPGDFSPESHTHVCNGAHAYLGKGSEKQDESVIDNTHSHTAPSLFFYENRQGIGETSKKQSQDGITITNPNPVEGDLTSGWKDNKPYGSYIEVIGYFKCQTLDASVGHGKIIYRFMLGQDVDKDFNSNRNTHYKLTLRMKGYGNDADWHIEYKEKPGIYTNSPVYVSYLYNIKTNITVKIVGELYEDKIYASIEGTDEYGSGFPAEAKFAAGTDPNDPVAPTYWRPWGSPDYPQFNDPETSDEYGNPTYQKTYGGIATGNLTQYQNISDGPWTSFLSLRPYNRVRIDDPSFKGISSIDGTPQTPALRNDWIDHKSGWIEYNASSGIHTPGDNVEPGLNGDQGQYQVVKFGTSSNTTTILTLPVYTRPKELITKTGFTGNNPYFNYARREKVKISVKIKTDNNGGYEWKHAYIDMIQVPRVENPKGVWRNLTNDPFHVILMYNMKDDGDYVPITSYGKWSAEVVGTYGIITLSTTPEGSGSDPEKQLHNVSRIEGADERPIDFKINFTGVEGFAMVKVRYNNYTCEHRIFCRKGYSDTKLSEDGPYWSLYNVYRFDKNNNAIPTQSPLEEGSLFRRGNFTAILAESHDNPASGYGYPGLGIVGSNGYTERQPATKFKVLKKDSETEEDSETVEEMDWSDITSSTAASWTIGGKPRIATIKDFYTLTDAPGKGNAHEHIGKGYGILYGDGAVSTQTDKDMARGYRRADGLSSERGMRGVIVYNDRTYAQIFLPIGALGHGRIKGDGSWQPSPKDPAGTLRYASRTAYFPPSAGVFQPLFYDIFKRPGAIYWCKERKNIRKKYLESGYTEIPKNEYTGKPINEAGVFDAVDESCDFDINYFTMGFEGFLNAADGLPNSSEGTVNKSDACFIRTTHD